MTIGIVFIVIALIIGIVAFVLVARSNIDQRREAIGARLRALTAATGAKAIAPDIEICRRTPGFVTCRKNSGRGSTRCSAPPAIP